MSRFLVLVEPNDHHIVFLEISEHSFKVDIISRIIVITLYRDLIGKTDPIVNLEHTNIYKVIESSVLARISDVDTQSLDQSNAEDLNKPLVDILCLVYINAQRKIGLVNSIAQAVKITQIHRITNQVGNKT